MKLCRDHFTELGSRIDNLGLMRFCANSPEEAKRRIKDPDSQYDPFILSVTMVQHYVHLSLGTTADPPGCPVCFVINACPCKDLSGCGYNCIIEEAVNVAYQRGVDKGLIVRA